MLCQNGLNSRYAVQERKVTSMGLGSDVNWVDYTKNESTQNTNTTENTTKDSDTKTDE